MAENLAFSMRNGSLRLRTHGASVGRPPCLPRMYFEPSRTLEGLADAKARHRFALLAVGDARDAMAEPPDGGETTECMIEPPPAGSSDGGSFG
jgi:hypothetical protein